MPVNTKNIKNVETLRNRLTKEIVKETRKMPNLQNEEVVMAFALIIGEMIDKGFVDEQETKQMLNDIIDSFLEAMDVHRKKKL